MTAEIDGLLARSVLWKALGRPRVYPSDGLMATFGSGLFGALVKAAWARVADQNDLGAAEPAQGLRASLAEDIGLGEEHTLLIQRAGAVPTVRVQGLRSGALRQNPENLGELSRLLEKLGLRLTPETGDLVDHIAVLIEPVGHTLASRFKRPGTGGGRFRLAEVRRGLV